MAEGIPLYLDPPAPDLPEVLVLQPFSAAGEGVWARGLGRLLALRLDPERHWADFAPFLEEREGRRRYRDRPPLSLPEAFQFLQTVQSPWAVAGALERTDEGWRWTWQIWKPGELLPRQEGEASFAPDGVGAAVSAAAERIAAFFGRPAPGTGPHPRSWAAFQAWAEGWEADPEARVRAGGALAVLEGLARALEADPAWPEARRAVPDLALALERGVLPQGEGALGRIAAAVGDDPALWWVLGEIRHRRGDREGARAALERAVALPDPPPRAWYRWGTLLEAAGRRRQAEAAYRRALEAGVREGALLDRLAGLLAARGRLEEAGRLWQEAVEVDPQRAGAWANLGRWHAHAGRREEAHRCYVKALELDPQWWGTYYYLALLKLEEGDRETAEEYLKAAQRRLPEGDEAGAQAIRQALAELSRIPWRRWLRLLWRRWWGPGS